jgi:tripartite-type tricarboxylate transporter receptor subunit TctC
MRLGETGFALLVAVVAIVAIPAAPPEACAQVYPARPIRVIVPAAAGGAGDIVARATGQKLAEKWGQQVIVDNRTGIVGTEIVARSAPDGYTLLLTTSALAVRESVFRDLPFSALRDFAPVTQLMTQTNILVLHPGVPVKSVAELIAYARARPGELNYGSSGNGGSNHLAGELFKSLARVNIVHVPYKGLPQAVTDLLAGRVQLIFGSPASTLPHTGGGRLRMLAVTTPRRSPALPDLPTIAEAGVPGYEFTSWIGVLAPARTPPAIVLKLQRELSAIVQSPESRQRFAADATDAVGSTPGEFTAFLKSEIARWTRVAREADIRVD